MPVVEQEVLGAVRDSSRVCGWFGVIETYVQERRPTEQHRILRLMAYISAC